ncbi:MAG TPA: recombination protein RecR, partial [Marinobacter sp.]|nr:recombination protein RecR [Marinobacter sp.]
MAFSPLVDELVESLRCLPGVGQKTAQRMAFHLLERGRSGGTRLAGALSQAMDGVRRCDSCQNFSDTDICQICEKPERRTGTLCVV